MSKFLPLDDDFNPQAEPAAHDPADVARVLRAANPFLADVQGDEAWIEAACDVINDIGARRFLQLVLDTLRASGAMSDDAEDMQEIALAEDAVERVMDHVWGERVALLERLPGAERHLGPAEPVAIDLIRPPEFMLVFDDAHGLPIPLARLRPELMRQEPSEAELEAVVGKFLVWVDLAEPHDGSPYLELYFHDDQQLADVDLPEDWEPPADAPDDSEPNPQLDELIENERRIRSESIILRLHWLGGARLICPGDSEAR